MTLSLEWSVKVNGDNLGSIVVQKQSQSVLAPELDVIGTSLDTKM